jgi:pyridoxine kinase
MYWTDMSYKRILTVQDISCLGQCSAMVALPILSACGLETCLLPTMVLSTHTGGLGTPVRRDLTVDLLPICDHWQSQDISFDGICVGYLGKAEQAQMVAEISCRLLAEGGLLVVDPAMADHGKCYSGIDEGCVHAMKALCRQADVILPNVTEACFLADVDYHEPSGEEDVRKLLDMLETQYGGTIVLTGVELQPGHTGFALRCNGKDSLYQRPRVGKSYHGTGDMFTAVFSGALLQGRTSFDAAVLAAEYVARAAENTFREPAHDYGVKFETVLPWLVQQI